LSCEQMAYLNAYASVGCVDQDASCGLNATRNRILTHANQVIKSFQKMVSPPLSTVCERLFVQ
ncbi:MAG: hypothetical protein ACP5VS_19400, partial [Desulfomonilaceae bacterium]